MTTFVLVHGAWHGGWCWQKVTPLLEAAGHSVLAPDLPGHGDDSTPIAQVTLEAYAERIVEIMDRAGEPVVLVGHSMGGIVITQAAELRPDGVAGLVYVTAFIPANGETLGALAAGNTNSRIARGVTTPHPGRSTTVNEEAIQPTFYGDCSPSDVAWAKKRLCAQAIAPIVTPVATTDAGWGRIPRAYIECTRDEAITIAYQRKMQGDHLCDPVLTMETDHSPFLSAPEELAGHLLSLATD
jgi:pimeloyl-ACP methyl ester carboxylesterase